MITNVVVIDSNNIVHNIIAVDDNTRESTRQFWVAQGYTCVDDAHCSPGDSYENGIFVHLEPPEPPPVRIISKADFRNRFTTEEKLAIYSSTDIIVKIFLDDLAAIDMVDLDSANIISGVQALETAGLLISERTLEILS